MDCAADATDIERVISGLPGADAARVSVASQVLTLPNGAVQHHPDIEAAVARLGFQLEKVTTAQAPLSEREPGYRRALWIVVGLNLGFGVCEVALGFWAHSQALRADALDFIGDGAITMLGIIAIRRSIRWRAQAAFLQGLFLGALGLGVLGNTLYRAWTPHAPNAEAMGVVSVLAVLVNVAAVVVLLPYRAGDSNVRAVWLFSRNDAIGNLLVLGSAIIVALTGSAWPDLIVAGIVAGIFLHSSGSIIKDARQDLSADSA